MANKKRIQKNCDQFLMEVISSLCFGGKETPDSDLVKHLMYMALQDLEGSDFTPSVERDTKSPIFRSFLLQILVEHK